MRRIDAVLTAVLAGTFSLVGALAAAAPAHADGCPGNPDAIGTSRVIAIKYGDYTKLGRLQYPQSLPLADHEVVLTFDDGPVRMLSDKALDILNAQCVKVTYFLVGEMAHYYPDVVRREYASGDVIGTHSMHHPLPFNRLSDQQVQAEIDEGIASVGAALGDPKELAPFFRIPGFGRSDVVEQELAKRKLIVFSTDVDADDWFRHITPAQIVQRAMSRLEKRGRGILLLHDIHPATVLALADLLKQLKSNGFHIVQVVPAGPGRPETPPEPLVAAAPPGGVPGVLGLGQLGTPAWPTAMEEDTVTGNIALAAPDVEDFGVKYAADGVAGDSVATAAWPEPTSLASSAVGVQLAAPSPGDIGVSMSGQTLVGAAANGKRHKAEVAHAIRHGRTIGRDRARVRHARLDRQHADLSSGTPTLAALSAPRAGAMR